MIRRAVTALAVAAGVTLGGLACSADEQAPTNTGTGGWQLDESVSFADQEPCQGLPDPWKPLPLDSDEIGEMDVGDSGYTVPWAIRLDVGGNAWLDPGHTIDSEPDGTVQMLVYRAEDGYHVWPSDPDISAPLQRGAGIPAIVEELPLAGRGGPC